MRVRIEQAITDQPVFRDSTYLGERRNQGTERRFGGVRRHDAGPELITREGATNDFTGRRTTTRRRTTTEQSVAKSVRATG